jgi:hypothetical protein
VDVLARGSDVGAAATPPRAKQGVEVRTAAELRRGDFVQLRGGGVVVVLRVFAFDSGRQCVVRPAEGGRRRTLFFWLGERVRVRARSGGNELTTEARPRGAAARGRGARAAWAES